MGAHTVDPLLQWQEHLKVGEVALYKFWGVEHLVDRVGGMDKKPAQPGEVIMGHLRVELPGEALVAGLGEAVASLFEGAEYGMELFAVGVVSDVVTVTGEHGGLEGADPGGQKHLMGIKMHIKTAAAHPMPSPLPEDHTDALLDGADGVAAGITVDTKKGVVDLRDSMDSGDEDLKVFTHLGDIRGGGLEDSASVALFVGLKPLFVVV